LIIYDFLLRTAMILIFCLIFYNLIFEMKNKHNQEYHKLCVGLTSYFFFIIITLILNSKIITIGITELDKELNSYTMIFKSITLYFNIIIILLLKSNDDPIQGISVLDDLLKVSIFQSYKSKRDQGEKQIFIDNLVSEPS